MNPRKFGANFARGKCNHMFAMIRECSIVVLQTYMSRERPRSHLAEIEDAVSQRFNETPFSFGKFGQKEIGQGLCVFIVRILHDLPRSASFVFYIVHCLNDLPAILQCFLTPSDIDIFKFTEQGIPALAIGIIGVSHPLLMQDEQLF